MRYQFASDNTAGICPGSEAMRQANGALSPIRETPGRNGR